MIPLSDNMNTSIGAENNIRATTRELKLGRLEGARALVDDGSRVMSKDKFQGQSSLMVKMDPQTNLWTFNYKTNGLLPEPLQGKFTSFSKAYDFAEGYFARRNIRITEVLD